MRMSESCGRWSRLRPDLLATLAAVAALAGLPFAACRPVSHRAAAPNVRRGIAGVVYDSLSYRALRGATVQIVDAGRPASHPLSLQTNDRGEYAAESLPPGRYLATF